MRRVTEATVARRKKRRKRPIGRRRRRRRRKRATTRSPPDRRRKYLAADPSATEAEFLEDLPKLRRQHRIDAALAGDAGHDGAARRWAAELGLSGSAYRAKAAAIGRHLKAIDGGGA